MADKCFVCQYEMKANTTECIYMGLTATNEYGYAMFDRPFSGLVMHTACFKEMAGDEYLASMSGQRAMLETDAAKRNEWLEDHTVYATDRKKGGRI